MARTAVVDGDGHIFENDAEIFEFLEPPYQGNRIVLAFPFFPTLDGYHRGALTARRGLYVGDFSVTAKTWLDFLDEVNVESTVLYPSAGLSYGLIQDPVWAVAVAKAYNNWLSERFQKESDRLRGVALIPLQNVPEAVKELRRAVTELGMIGAVLPANGGDLGVRKPLGDPEFWPIFEEAERLDCALAVHGAPSQGIGLDLFNRFACSMALEHPFSLMVQMTSMVFEGVFERFPTLRVGYLEAGTGWVPYMMDRLDRQQEVSGLEKGGHTEYSDWMKKTPSDYVKSGKLFFSCEGGEESLRYAVERLGDEGLIFASDFPHENDATRCKHEIDEMLERPDLTEETKQKILVDNTIRFYGR